MPQNSLHELHISSLMRKIWDRKGYGEREFIMAKVIAICNQKGGVSKTTTTSTLAIELSRMGKKVLAVDGDPQGSLSLLFGVTESSPADVYLTDLMRAQIRRIDYDVYDAILETEEGVDLIPADASLEAFTAELTSEIGREKVLRKVLEKVKEDYDIILIDGPPSLGILTINELTASDQVLVPLQASILSVKGLILLIDNIIKVRDNTNPDLWINGIFFSMVQPNTAVSSDIIDYVKEHYGENLYIYKTVITRAIVAENAARNLMSIPDFAPKSKLALLYKEFAKEFLERLEG